MRYEIHFSKYVNDKYNDHWKWQTVEGDTEKEAKEKLIKEHDQNGKYIKYFLSCTLLD